MPESIRYDNGPELTSRHFLGWCEERKIPLIHNEPGRPMQKGHVESFNGRLRDECLNASWFRNLPDTRERSRVGGRSITASDSTVVWLSHAQ